MTRLRAIVLLLAAFGLAAAGTGCTTTHNDADRQTGGYYRRGSVHRDSFPVDYIPGRHRSWGSTRGTSSYRY